MELVIYAKKVTKLFSLAVLITGTVLYFHGSEQVYRSWLWGSLQNKMTVKRNPNEIYGLIDLCKKRG
jgi:hypothetical protein